MDDHEGKIIVRSDKQSRVTLRDARPGEEFVALKDVRGGYYFMPVSALEEGEQAVFNNPGFLKATIQGLQDVAEGRVKSLDWVTDLSDL